VRIYSQEKNSHLRVLINYAFCFFKYKLIPAALTIANVPTIIAVTIPSAVCGTFTSTFAASSYANA